MSLPKTTLAPETNYYIQATAAPSPERALVLKQGDTFGVFDEYGDIEALERSEEGIYHRGTRFLSCLKLGLLESRPLLLSSTVRRDNVLLGVDLTNPDIFCDGTLLLPRGTLHIYRSQFLWEGALYVCLRIRNFALTPIEISFGMQFAADFVDIFEVRGEKRERRGVQREPQLRNKSREAVLEYEGLDGVARRTVVRSSPVAQVMLPSSLQFSLELPPKDERVLEFSFGFELDNQIVAPTDYVHGLALAGAGHGPDQVASLITTSNDQFNSWLERSRADVNMLLTAVPNGVYPYAGVPWFSTPFGRMESSPLWNACGSRLLSRGACWPTYPRRRPRNFRPNAMPNPERSCTKRAMAKWPQRARFHSAGTTEALMRRRCS